MSTRDSLKNEREEAIRDVCATLATWGMDSSAFNYATALMERFGIPLDPTFKTSMLPGGTEVVELVEVYRVRKE